MKKRLYIPAVARARREWNAVQQLLTLEKVQQLLESTDDPLLRQLLGALVDIRKAQAEWAAAFGSQLDFLDDEFDFTVTAEPVFEMPQEVQCFQPSV